MKAEVRSLSQKINELRRQLVDDGRRESDEYWKRASQRQASCDDSEEGGDQPHAPRAAAEKAPRARERQTVPIGRSSVRQRPPPIPHHDTNASTSPTHSSPTMSGLLSVGLPGVVDPPNGSERGEEDDRDDGQALAVLEEALLDKGDQLAAHEPKRKTSTGSAGLTGFELKVPTVSEVSSGRVRFDMLDIYEDFAGTWAKQTQVVSELTGGHYRTPRQVTLRQNGTLGLDELLSGRGFAKWVTGRPRSPIRVAWEIMGSAFIIYDMVMVPLTVFCYPDTRVTISMEWLTLIFWTLNMVNTITVGFEHEHSATIVMDNVEIIKNYLRCWFWWDLVVLLPDWLFSILTFGTRKPGLSTCESTSEGSTIKLLRSLRLVRLVRLTRVAKLRKMWQKLQQMIYSVTASIAANIIAMVALLLVISHFISCVWFHISFTWDGDDRWLTRHDMDDAAWYYQYATAMHWSITQFTPASMQIVPHNIVERVFTICVVVFALVGFSYVVGSITGSLTQLRSLHEEESKQFWDLRRYLRVNHVEMRLSKRIQRYLEHAWQREAELQNIKQIKILNLLSEQLYSELLFELSNRHLKVHPLFEELHSVSRVSVFRLASSAIHNRQLANNDHLFIRGEAPSHMYLVIQGRLEYKKRDSLGKVRQEQVDKGEDWIAEPSMWSYSWYHLGDCQAVLESRLMLVDPMHFAEVVKRNPSAWLLVTTYCRKFLEWLNSLDVDDLSDISQGEDIGDLLRGFMELPEGTDGDEPEVEERRSTEVTKVTGLSPPPPSSPEVSPPEVSPAANGNGLRKAARTPEVS